MAPKINADTLIRLSGKSIFKPILGHLLLLLASRSKDPYNFSYPFFRADLNGTERIKDFISSLLSIIRQYKWLTVWFTILTLRSINQIGHRLIMNPLGPRQIVWRDQVVVVSGGARGIMGRVVEYLTDRGAKVVAIDLADHSQNGRESLYIKCNVTDEKALIEAKEEINRKLGKITMVLVGHGITRHSFVLDDPKTFPSSYQGGVVDVNLVGVQNFTQVMSQDLISRGSKGGHILLLGSGAAYSALPGNSGYNSSKSGVVSLYHTLSIELDTWHRAKNVRCSVFCPLKVESDMTKGRMEDQGNQFLFPTLTINGVAQDIVTHLEADAGGMVFTPKTGAGIAFASGCLPEWVMRAVYKSLGSTDTFLKWARNNRKVVADH